MVRPVSETDVVVDVVLLVPLPPVGMLAKKHISLPLKEGPALEDTDASCPQALQVLIDELDIGKTLSC